MNAKKALISPKEWKIFIIASVILCFIAGGVTMLVISSQDSSLSENVLPKQYLFKNEVADTIPEKVLLTDFLLPAPFGQGLSYSWRYSRSLMRRWLDKDIAPYWVPVDALPFLQLPQTNDKMIDQLFQDIP